MRVTIFLPHEVLKIFKYWASKAKSKFKVKHSVYCLSAHLSVCLSGCLEITANLFNRLSWSLHECLFSLAEHCMYRCKGFSIFPQFGSVIVLIRVSFVWNKRPAWERVLNSNINSNDLKSIFRTHRYDIVIFNTILFLFTSEVRKWDWQFRCLFLKGLLGLKIIEGGMNK